MRDAKRLAEVQATVLLAEAGIDRPPVPGGLIELLPGIEVAFNSNLNHSGVARWDGNRWLIEISSDESPPRQRMTIFHELKHVIDDPLVEETYSRDITERERRAERLADYFAAQVLMPKTWVKHDFRQGIREVEALASRYEVSRSAMKTQLEELGLANERRNR